MILNQHEQTKLALLQELINANASISRHDLMNTLSISLSTLKRDIQHLNSDIHSIPEFQSIHIIFEKGHYFLQNPSPFNPHYIIKKINLIYHKKSLHYNFFKRISSCSVKSISELTNEFSISQPYFYKLVAQINRNISPFQIKIEYSKTDELIYIAGNKQNIRLVEMYFFWNVNQGIEWPFDTVSIEQLHSHFSSKELDLFFKMSKNKQQKFLYSLAVIHQVFPHKQNNLVLSDDFYNTVMVYQDVNDLSKPLENLLLSSYGSTSDQKRIQLERNFFNFSARAFCPCTDPDEKQIEIGKRLYQLDNDLILYSKKYMLTLFKYFPELVENPQIEYQMLYYWVLYFANIFYVHFDSSHLNNFMMISSDIEVQQTPLFHKAREVFHRFLNENPMMNTTELSDFHLNLGYGLTYYFLVNLEFQPLTLHIQFSKNMFGETYIKAKLYQMFGRENIIFTDNIHAASLVISNYFEDHYKNSKYFYLDNLVDTDAWGRLYTLIHEMKTASN